MQASLDGMAGKACAALLWLFSPLIFSSLFCSALQTSPPFSLTPPGTPTMQAVRYLTWWSTTHGFSLPNDLELPTSGGATLPVHSFVLLTGCKVSQWGSLGAAA